MAISDAQAALTRWIEHGGTLRVRSLDAATATVELCTCYGEAVDELTSADPELLALLRTLPVPAGQVASAAEAAAMLDRARE